MDFEQFSKIMSGGKSAGKEPMNWLSEAIEKNAQGEQESLPVDPQLSLKMTALAMQILGEKGKAEDKTAVFRRVKPYLSARRRKKADEAILMLSSNGRRYDAERI